MVDMPGLCAPPRPVPWSLRVQVLGSGALALVGWLVTGFGLVFAMLFLRHAEPLSGDPFDGPLASVSGRVLAVESTGASVNSRHVWRVRFAYEVAGRSLQGTSYGSGEVPAVDADVPVDYVAGDPVTARVRGMRTAMFPAVVWFVLILPGAGLVLLCLAVWTGWRRVGLLQHGVLTTGRLVASRPTNTRINQQRVHELTFRYRGADGQERDGTVRTHRLQSVSDEAEETLFCDPAGDRIVLWDLLPRRPEIDRDGHFLPVGLGGLWFVLLPPTVVGLLVVVVQNLFDG
ncbi:MAG: DUF3592 domain-containing protein [Planctomycetes bacterium]|nr:DUF3592 domain-containing protein [Planctomycetota bacterium]